MEFKEAKTTGNSVEDINLERKVNNEWKEIRRHSIKDKKGDIKRKKKEARECEWGKRVMDKLTGEKKCKGWRRKIN